MSYLRELNKTSKMQQGLFFLSTPSGFHISIFQERTHCPFPTQDFYLQCCSVVLYNSTQCPVQSWPNWSKFIQLGLSIQPFVSPPISSVIRLLIQPSFISFTSCINSDCVLFPQTVGACRYFFCCLRGGKVISHFYQPCLVYFLSDVNALLLPWAGTSRARWWREGYKRSLSAFF